MEINQNRTKYMKVGKEENNKQENLKYRDIKPKTIQEKQLGNHEGNSKKRKDFKSKPSLSYKYEVSGKSILDQNLTKNIKKQILMEKFKTD